MTLATQFLALTLPAGTASGPKNTVKSNDINNLTITN